MLKDPLLKTKSSHEFYEKTKRKYIFEKSNPVLGLSSTWFEGSEFLKLSFDFFINYKTNKLSPQFLIKKVFDSAKSLQNFKENNIYPTELSQEIFDLKVNGYFNYLLLEEYSYSENIFLLDKNNGKISDIELLSKSGLELLIRENTGKSLQVGQKGLIYYTTQMEKELSTTPFSYTGDADCVLFDKETKKPVLILEYQKHQKNKNGDLIDNENFLNSVNYFSEQRLENKTNQNLKFFRLEKLSEELSDQKIPLFILHYSTKNNIDIIVLEEFKNGEKTIFSYDKKDKKDFFKEIINFFSEKYFVKKENILKNNFTAHN